MIINKPIPIAGVTVLQSQDKQSLAVTTVFFCNTDNTTADDITIYLIPAGASAASSNMIVNQKAIPAGDTLIFEYEKLILENGDMILAKSSKGLITSVCSYMDIS